jgi:hypothetical protein
MQTEQVTQEVHAVKISIMFEKPFQEKSLSENLHVRSLSEKEFCGGFGFEESPETV